MLMDSFWGGIEGLILDAVGTVIEPDPPVADVYLASALRQGVVLDRQIVKRRFSLNFRNDELDEARGPLVTDEAIESRRWRRIVTAVLPEVPDPDAAFRQLWDHFARPDAWFCFPDVAPALIALRRAGILVVIGSNFDERLRSVVAGLPQIQDMRESLVISSEVGFRKPHPRFYEAACARLGLPPEKVLCVGDDLENDVLGAQRTGCRGFLLDRQDLQSRDANGCPDLLALTKGLTIASVSPP
jgi:putative hydrolase of the HAD superfamily